MGWEMLPPLDRVREGVEGGYDSQIGIHSSLRGFKGFLNP